MNFLFTLPSPLVLGNKAIVDEDVDVFETSIKFRHFTPGGMGFLRIYGYIIQFLRGEGDCTFLPFKNTKSQISRGGGYMSFACPPGPPLNATQLEMAITV